MSRRIGERSVAGDERRIDRLGEGDVHGVVGREVVSQLPRATNEIEVGVTVEVEVGEIRDRFLGATGPDLARPNEASEALKHLDVHQVGRMKLVLVAEEPGFHSFAQCGLKEKLHQS
jgi:hypothetical protein